MAEPDNDTYKQILAVADELFSSRGYASVTLRDIAVAVGMRHASLYYYAPEGKEQLFIEVMKRNFERHRVGLEQAIAHAEPNIRAQLHAVADWLVSQPPMDLVRMTHADLPALNKAKARRLFDLAYAALFGPIEAALTAAGQRGEIAAPDMGLVAGGVISMIEGLYAVPSHALEYTGRTTKQMAYTLIDLMLNGLYK
jgi:AcrR family transcriptional regulator